MCDCYSPSWFLGSRPAEVLENPFTGEGVAIDYCIADSVSRLWAHGIETKNSCCGHNKAKPIIMLADNSDANTFATVRELLVEYADEREFTLASWNRVEDIDRD